MGGKRKGKLSDSITGICVVDMPEESIFGLVSEVPLYEVS